MLHINLFRGFLTQILTLDLSFITIFAPLATKAVFGDRGLISVLGFQKLNDIYEGHFHWDLAMSLSPGKPLVIGESYEKYTQL